MEKLIKRNFVSEEYLKYSDAPSIPSNLTSNDFIVYLQILADKYEFVEFVPYNDHIKVVVSTAADPTIEVNIPSALYNSKANGNTVCKVLFEISTANPDEKHDYFGKHSKCILNMPQVIFITLQNRLAQLQGQARAYADLINKDMKRLRGFIDYNPPITYNAKQKVNNLYAIVAYSGHSEDVPMGEYIESAMPTEKEWTIIFNDLGDIVQPSSESSMHKRAKLTLSKQPIYRSVGFKVDKPNGCYWSLFASKQNVPARLKTHLLSNGYALDKPDLSVFQQDCLLSDDKKTLLPKDNTMREAIIVFDSMNKETLRFVGGEIEASERIAKSLAHLPQTLHLVFNESSPPLEIGKLYTPNFEEFQVGLDNEMQPVIIRDVKEFTVKSVEAVGIAGTMQVKLDTVIRVGNARIISNTGLKGVTKVKTRLGKIAFPKENITETEFSPAVKRILSKKDTDYSKYLKVTDTDLQHTHNLYDVDLIAGMNAVKAKSNTIVTAQAALAVKLGYYKPTKRFDLDTPLLDSYNVKEIQEAADSLPEFLFYDEFGQSRQVYVGLIYINYTELGSIFTDFKKQSFPFEAAKFIKQNNLELYNYITNNHIDKDVTDVAKELYKILNDTNGYLARVDKLPRYTAAELRKRKIIVEKDLILTRIEQVSLAIDSKLLDENFNKGFYLDLTNYKNGKLIRIPSAKTLKLFNSITNDGSFTYHQLVISTSKLLNAIVGKNLSIGYIFPNSSKKGLYDDYMGMVRGTLFSSEDAHQMVVQSFVKPRVNGLNMKQVIEPLLPKNVVVVLDNYTYRKILRESFTNSELDFEQIEAKVEVFNLNTSIVTNTTSTERIVELLSDVPYGMAMRQPFLWEEQLQVVRIWNKDLLSMYLKRFHKITLDTYIHPTLNRDIVLVSSEVAMKSHSDCDGDLLPIHILTNQGQELLRNFKLDKVLEEETLWHEKYVQSELETDLDLKLGSKHQYKLHKVSSVFGYEENGGAVTNYPQYLLNASVAKGNIGPATIDIWALTAVLQTYKAYCIANNNRLIVDGVDKGPLTQVLSDQDISLITFIYTVVVQEQVVEGIKHVTGGSSNFGMYYLDNLSKRENRQMVTETLHQQYGMSKQHINKLLYVVNIADAHGFLSACKSFITKYNKGKLPVKERLDNLNKWESFIQSSTFFGELVQPLFELNQLILNRGRVVLSTDNDIDVLMVNEDHVEIDDFSL